MLPLPPHIDTELLKQKSKENFQHRYGLATGFLNGADYYLHFKAYGLACFSLQQASENALIAIIRAILDYRLNIHNLTRLLRITEMFTPELKAVFDSDMAKGTALFQLIQKAYHDPRYRDDFKTDEASVSLLFGLVSKLLDRVKNVYGQAFAE